MQHFYHVDLDMKSTTKFVSTFFEPYNSSYKFYKILKKEMISFIFQKTLVPKTLDHLDLHLRRSPSGDSVSPNPTCQRHQEGDELQ